MQAEQKPKQFPATNQEFFRLVIKSVLLFAAIVFAIFLAVHMLWVRTGLRSDAALRYLGLSMLIGLALTLWRLRWMKWRDSRG
jgi:amino acid transporter